MHTYHNYHEHSHRFANKELVEIFLFQLLKELAFGLIGIFVPIFLLLQGMPLFYIMMLFTVRSALHGIFAFFFSRTVLFKIGIKHTFVISMFLYAVSFFVIKQEFSMLSVWSWVLITGFANALYASAHHSYLALNIDEYRAGREVAFLGVTSVFAGIFAPLVGALFISSIGFKDMFVAGSVILILSVIPLFFSKETNILSQVRLKWLDHFKEFWKSRKAIAISTVGHGFDGASDPLWSSLYIYKLLNGIKLLGALRTVISFLQMLTGYIGGWRLDKNKSSFEVGINGSIFARLLTFVSFHPYVAIMSEAADGVIKPLFSMAYNATFYNQLKGDYAISRVVAHESIWHAAHVLALIIITVAAYFFDWYAFLVAGLFMVIGRLIIRDQRVGIRKDQ